MIFSNALHVAVEHGAVEVVRLLLKYGLEPNQGGCLVETPPSRRSSSNASALSPEPGATSSRPATPRPRHRPSRRRHAPEKRPADSPAHGGLESNQGSLRHSKKKSRPCISYNEL